MRILAYVLSIFDLLTYAKFSYYFMQHFLLFAIEEHATFSTL